MQADVHFRAMKIEDIPAVLEVEHASFPTPWTRQAFIQEIKHNRMAHYTVVEVAERVIGYCGMWVIMDEAHITNFAILPTFRGYSLGESTMHYVRQLALMLGATKMTLEVRPSNKVALALYQKLGFEQKGIRPRYYSDNHEDAIIMWVTLHEK
ncbi:ribosomal protein S18-alanine N-acetyltransferase [Mechercharimyces sp. CAU 1602]|uniref:ribosomal protein S18-alanine N-acetyltransferase n=1 Tax=Mechercharimyces sp. CAU 1602 TaxID=2973933 RepID=UPI0021626384|nr:ribosomal protein S18-alanine N-acetyltransferase [Mechercharimyces sp. CAU 1602]MCS1352124.1 ribosomal protein S18-alanine N-acetyltransferase [Mechercharimyces sp. CAU 1602]